MSDLVTGFLDDGRVHVFDGAMGTLLYSRGVFVNVCYDELNLSRPELVEGIHQEYVGAGAELPETHTPRATPVKLSSSGSNITMALAPKSVSHTLSRSST